MTLDQELSFALVAATVGCFVWGRLPYDLVAVGALLAGVLLGVVPARKAFEGFSDEVVIIIAAALVISAGIARSGIVEAAMRPITPRLRSVGVQVPVLVGLVMALSMVSKNVGALAIFMPVALQLARRTGTSPSSLLMPMASASMLGGIVTLVGTSPNILIAKVRADVLGHPFGMFDFTPVGLSIAVLGAAFLSVGWRLLPGGRRAASSVEAAFNMEDYTAEARVGAGSAAVGRTVAALEAMAEGDVGVALVVRERFRRLPPHPGLVVREEDVLLLRGEPADLERLVTRARLTLAGGGRGEAMLVEGVVTAESPLVGQSLAHARLEERFAIGVLAVSRSGQRIGQRLASVRLRVGDVMVLRSASPQMPERLGELHVLPLAERAITLGRNDRSAVPALVLAVAMVLVAVHVLPVAIAFFGAAVVLLLLRVLTMHEAYGAVEWHVIVLIGALIPISHAVQDSGGTKLIAGWLLVAMHAMPGWGALAAVLVITLVVTPFLHNAPTVLIMGPIAASLATGLGFSVDTFLMAVALGAGCDFLTPIGHQCNTLVMGPGGYRFGDYARLGAPLSLIVVMAGVPLLMLFWPLSGH
ncbi:MAG: SLC13 family permease [Janthinobacterium lividum]